MRHTSIRLFSHTTAMREPSLLNAMQNTSEPTATGGSSRPSLCAFATCARQQFSPTHSFIHRAMDTAAASPKIKQEQVAASARSQQARRVMHAEIGARRNGGFRHDGRHVITLAMSEAQGPRRRKPASSAAAAVAGAASPDVGSGGSTGTGSPRLAPDTPRSESSARRGGSGGGGGGGGGGSTGSSSSEGEESPRAAQRRVVAPIYDTHDADMLLIWRGLAVRGGLGACAVAAWPCAHMRRAAARMAGFRLRTCRINASATTAARAIYVAYDGGYALNARARRRR